MYPFEDSYSFSEKYCSLLMNILTRIKSGKRYKKLEHFGDIIFPFSNFNKLVDFKIILSSGYLDNGILLIPKFMARGICFSDKIIIPVFYNGKIYNETETSGVIVHELTHLHQHLTGRIETTSHLSALEWATNPCEIEANENMFRWICEKQ
jgi:hypothetical protein